MSAVSTSGEEHSLFLMRRREDLQSIEGESETLVGAQL